MLGLWAGHRDLPLLEPTLAGIGDLIGPLLDRPLYLRKRRHGAEDAGTDAHLPAGLLGAAIDGRPLVAPPGGRTPENYRDPDPAGAEHRAPPP